jgi:hypothetical protein
MNEAEIGDHLKSLFSAEPWVRSWVCMGIGTVSASGLYTENSTVLNSARQREMGATPVDVD